MLAEKLGDNYVLELFAGTAGLTRSMRQKVFMPWRLEKVL